jgi:hypothetical protein
MFIVLALLSLQNFATLVYSQQNCLKNFSSFAKGSLPTQGGKIQAILSFFLGKDIYAKISRNGHPFDRSVAIVVGIDDYSRCSNSKFKGKNLSAAVKDARDMTKFLLDYGFDVVYEFKNNDAEAERIKTLMKCLIRELRRDDRFLFFFSGHGSYKKLDTPVGELDEESYLIFGNANDYLDEGVIEHDEILKWGRKLNCKSQLFMLDCCYSGNIYKYKDPVDNLAELSKLVSKKTPEEFMSALAGVGRFILTAGGSKQVAVELDEQEFKGGLFTNFFLSGVRDQNADNGDGIVTIDEIRAYLNGMRKLSIRGVGVVTPKVIPIDEAESGLFFFIKSGTKSSPGRFEVKGANKGEAENSGGYDKAIVKIKVIPYGAIYINSNQMTDENRDTIYMIELLVGSKPRIKAVNSEYGSLEKTITIVPNQPLITFDFYKKEVR